MSKNKFSDDCPGCRPALMDLKTGKVLGPDTPEMKAIDEIWADTTKQEREAYHRFCCSNERSPSTMRLAGGIAERVRLALKALPGTL